MNEAFVKDLGLKKRFVTKVAISSCGNFGVAGFNDGYLAKVSMQSGSHMKTFYNTIAHQGKEIVGILIDSTNHSMVTADQNTVVLWDFFSGIYQQKVELSSDISMLVPDANSSIFGVVTHNEISLMELHSLRQVRTFIGHKGVINDCKLSIT